MFMTTLFAQENFLSVFFVNGKRIFFSANTK